MVVYSNFVHFNQIFAPKSGLLDKKWHFIQYVVFGESLEGGNWRKSVGEVMGEVMGEVLEEVFGKSHGP